MPADRHDNALDALRARTLVCGGAAAAGAARTTALARPNDLQRATEEEKGICTQFGGGGGFFFGFLNLNPFSHLVNLYRRHISVRIRRESPNLDCVPCALTALDKAGGEARGAREREGKIPTIEALQQQP